MLKKSEKNFILVEFLIFFAVAAVLLLVAGLVLAPLARFKNFRDSRRWIDITEILNAVKTSQIDGDDSYFIFSDIVPGEIYMITDGKMVANCDQANANCDTGVTDSDNCVDLSEFVALGYLKKIPISPMGRQNGRQAPLVIRFSAAPRALLLSGLASRKIPTRFDCLDKKNFTINKRKIKKI